MNICLGTYNEIKVQTVREFCASHPLLKDANVAPAPGVSGVAEQPVTLKETMQGAINRAEWCKTRAGDFFALGIGLESGLIPVKIDCRVTVLDVCVCAVCDGTNYHLGFSQAFPLPQSISVAVGHGMDLTQASLSTELTTDDRLGESVGLIGVLSGGKSTRAHQIRQALEMAFIKLERPELWGDQAIRLPKL